MNVISDPGARFMMPFVTSVEYVQVTLQTDEALHIPCGTSSGVMITFDKVEVVNRLQRKHVLETVRNYTALYDKIWIFDKIHHEINQFCSSHSLQQVYIDEFDSVDDRLAAALQESCNIWAPGIEIVAVRITKPTIPAEVSRNYVEMEAQRTKFLAEKERQNVLLKESETHKRKAEIQAMEELEVSRIRIQMELLEKEGERNRSAMENAMHIDKNKAMADAIYYSSKLQAEGTYMVMVMVSSSANALLLTPEYLRMKEIESITHNNKIYYGPSIPQFLMDNARVSDDGDSKH